MKHSAFITAFLLSLASFNALADEYDCKPISGIIQQLTPDPTCAILQSQAKHFPDTAFANSVLPNDQACFTSTLTATLGVGAGSRTLSGTANSGITLNPGFTLNEPNQLTAVSAIQLTAGPVELGKIYTSDVILDPYGNARELLTVTDGSKSYKGGKGHLVITGSALISATTFSGFLCTEL